MLIAQMTDTHIGYAHGPRGEELNRQRFAATLARILALPTQPDMLLLTGDVTDTGNAASFDRTAELVADCPFPVHLLVGNHDDRGEILRAFPHTPCEDGFLHRAFVADGLLVVLLDTFEPGRHGGAFCEKRRAWLRATLEAHADSPAVIFMHHPPVVSGIDWMDPDPDAGWITRFAEAIEGMDQLRAIHCGHLHRPLLTSFRGVPLGVTPSVAPAVALDLRPASGEEPDGRDLITSEPPAFALHYWDGETLATHYQTTGDWTVLATYGPQLQPMIREMEAEKGEG